MLLPDCEKIAVGYVVKTHGVKGELSVAIDGAFDGELSPGDPLIVDIDGLDVPFFVASLRMRGNDSLLLTLDDVDSDAAAAMFVGHTLWVYGRKSAGCEDLEDDGCAEITADRLVGYTVIDGDVTAGVIDDVREIAPDCWYFVLRDSGRLIPIADEMIQHIDHRRRIISMDLPAGLLDL